MKITLIDWVIIAVYMLSSFFLGILFTRRASKSTEEFFLSGRNLPWWLAGTSMAATAFSSDTPLYVTSLVRSHGVYENWQWWCFLSSGMLSVAVFARLWKSAGVMTDIELTELRYSGPSASVLRGIKAIYFSLFIHTIIKAQVVLAMAKILDVCIGWNKWEAILISSGITIFYSLMSGYWGVIVTDFLQFIIALAGAITLACIATQKAGGLLMFDSNISKIYGSDQYFMDFFPSMDNGLLSQPILMFIAYMGMSWWSKYSSDGGGVVVQRMVSSKNERHAIAATFYFNLVNYSIRSWPWILTAIASLILYPAIKDHESVYPIMVVELVPAGIKGLMLVSFFAAFMSTLSTYLNLSSVYFINDFYRRFLKKDGSERHYIGICRIVMLILSLITGIVTYFADSIVGIFQFLIAFGSGTGLVYIMRWFWWRVNAWSEISAMTASTLISSCIYILYPSAPFYCKLFFIILLSTITWVTVTFLTKPVEDEVLIRFYERIKIRGIGWRAIEGKIKGAIRHGNMSLFIANWAAGCGLIYGINLGAGMFLFGRIREAGICLAIAVVSAIFVYRGYARLY